MNKFLKYGVPGAFSLMLAMPAMAQSGGYNNNQHGQMQNGQMQNGQNGNWQGHDGYSQNGGNNAQNDDYSQNRNDGQNRDYSQGGNDGQHGNYGQNGTYGQNNWNNGQNGNVSQNGNEVAVTPQFVAHLQRRLRQAGYYNQADIDGLWGPNTQNALQNFQRHSNLRPTGQIDLRTLQALNMLNGDQQQHYGQNSNYQTYDRGNNRDSSYSNNNYGNGNDSNSPNGYGNNGNDNGMNGGNGNGGNSTR